MKKKISINLKKELKIETPPVNTSKTNNSDIEEKGENEEKQKESYSSFLIRMLEQPPKKAKKNKSNLSSTFYYNLTKRKTNNLFSTHYTPNVKRVTFSFDNNSNNPSIKNINKDKDNINNIKNIKNNNKVDIQKSIIDKKEQSKINNPIININDFASTQLNKENKKRFKSFNFKNKKIYNTCSNLNTNTNPNSLNKSILLNNIKKNKKLIKNIRSVNNINRNRLNALYGYDKNFLESKKYLLKSKDIRVLEKYQNDILKISQRNLSKDHMIKLFTELQSIKKTADLVKPLPPINYPALILHSFKEAEDRKKRISKLTFEDKKYTDLDDYEKELYKIKKSNLFKREKVIRNKRIYKIYEILPEHVIDTVYKNKNKIIK